MPADSPTVASDRSPPAAADRNLLFGILALQMDFISRDALITAMNAWVLNKAKSLGEILAEQGALKKEDRDLLEVIVKRHLQMHGNDVQFSLASLSSVGSLREELQKVADSEVHASLAFVPGGYGSKEEPHISRPPSAGEPSVPGVRFRILHEHARGGLGAVFVAQDEELHRQVALKEIQEKYVHHAESQSRFMLEAEVTGGLEHPGIVPVYGLGRYPDGRPFYAMRFIRGDSLHKAIQRFYAADREDRDPTERSLAFRELLGQFVAACNALAYAHDRGVLHRDVKPQNIMLGKYGETLVVDWGLAKVMGQRDGHSKSEEGILLPSVSGESTPTQAGHVMGTPAYMSPEQADGRLDLLGPASDIYSLGATLYELLTGQHPVQGQHVGEILSKVVAGEWLPPRKVRRDVPAALDAICRKAMALRPQDRYATALELAADVSHWLADEPVKAYREPFSGKLRRWVRRHRGLAAGVAGLLLTTVAALALGIVAVDREKDRTELARLRTRNLLNKTMQAVDGWLPRQSADLEPAQKKYLKEALISYQELARESGNSEEVRSGVADAYLRVGEIASRLGQLKEAEEAYRGAIERYQQLAADFPNGTDYRLPLATGSNGLGKVLSETGQSQEAEKVYCDGLAIQRQLVEAFPTVASYRQGLADIHNNLAILLKNTGRLPEAEEAYREAQKQLTVEFPDMSAYRQELASVQHNLGNVLLRTNRLDDSEKAFREAAASYQQLTDESPSKANYRHELAISQYSLGTLLWRRGRLKEAEEPLRKALALHQELRTFFPGIPQYRQELAMNQSALGTLLLNMGRPQDAEPPFREALANRKHLADKSRDTPSYRRDLARSYNDIGVLLAETGRPQEAEAAYRDARALQSKLAAEFPKVPDYHNELANTLVNLAELCRDRKDFAQARELLEAARPHHEAALKVNPQNPTYRQYFRNHQVILATTLAGLGDHDGARQTAEKLAAVGWDPPGDAYAGACALAQCLHVLGKDTEPQELLRSYAEQALTLLQQAIAKGYKNVANLKKDKDLDPLRSHAEFLKLLKELEAKRAAK